MLRSTLFRFAVAALAALATAGATLAHRGGDQVGQGAAVITQKPVIQLRLAQESPAPTGLKLDVHLAPEAAARLVEATRAGVGRQLAMLLNSRLVASASIVEPLATGRHLQMGLDLPKSSADGIAASIAARWPCERVLPPRDPAAFHRIVAAFGVSDAS